MANLVYLPWQNSYTINKFPRQRNLQDQITEFPPFSIAFMHRARKACCCPKRIALRGLITFKDVTSGNPIKRRDRGAREEYPACAHVPLEIHIFFSFMHVTGVNDGRGE